MGPYVAVMSVDAESKFSNLIEMIEPLTSKKSSFIYFYGGGYVRGVCKKMRELLREF